MHLIKNIFLLVLFVYLTGCEKTEIVEIDLEHEEYIVINSEIKSGEDFAGVSITRTLPVGITYDIKLAEIKDAYAYLRINETQVVPLHYSADGIYKSLYSFKIEPGYTYELFGAVNDKGFYSRTKAPHKPSIISASYTPDQFYLIKITPAAGEAYGAVWVISSGTDLKANDYYSIEKPQAVNPSAAINIRTQTLPEEYQKSSYIGRRFFQVFSFSEEFQSFFQTRGQNRPVDNSYVQGGGAVAWNVKGDKVIGLFMGVAEGIVSGEIR